MSTVKEFDNHSNEDTTNNDWIEAAVEEHHRNVLSRKVFDIRRLMAYRSGSLCMQKKALIWRFWEKGWES